MPNNTLENIRLYNNISLLTDKDLTSSKPVRICFCINGVPNCTYQPPSLHLYKGEKYKIALSAVDQVNHSIEGIIRGSLKSAKSVFKIFDQEMHSSSKNYCLNMVFSVITHLMSETLFLFAEGPCGNADQSQRTLKINFYNGCHCPIGFIPQDSDADCTCQCDSRLKNLTMSRFDCDILAKILIRTGDYWLGYDNNSRDYLIYSHCHVDYCKPAGLRIKINLTSPNGSVSQCFHNRQGILCSICQTGFSLSPSSFRCVRCPSYWPVLTIVTIIGSALAGIALVSLIMVLNLTVAFGTLNGIIFYANIFLAKGNTFLPFSKPNFFTVFIAALNLEFGIDFCFVEGLDAYWKTWLQLAFPIYVFSLVVIIILMSKSSMRFSRLIGKRNPVATLATLILLSYAKMLNTIIAILSFKVPTYPAGSQEKVWAFNATVKYLSGKHVVLFVAALFILLVGAIYTSLLIFWQWVLRYQHKAIFKLVRNQKLCQFLEPYHAPYNFKHRYWTGLLLVARIALYISSAINEAGSTSVDLMAVGVTVSGLLFLKGNIANVYRTVHLNVLETVVFINIIILCFAKLYISSVYRDGYEHTHNLLTYTSVSVTFGLFMVVVVGHTFSEIVLKTKVWTVLTAFVKKNAEEHILLSQVEGNERASTVTTSVIDGRPTKKEDAIPVKGSEFQRLRKPLLLSTDSTDEYT